MYCFYFVQNVQKKKRGKCLFAKHLPLISLIISNQDLFLYSSLRGWLIMLIVSCLHKV